MLLSFIHTLAIFSSACSTKVVKPNDYDGVALHEEAPVGKLTAMKDEGSRVRAKAGYKGMVVAEEPEASRWGTEILREGGNAIDAAVATALMLSVTRPNAGSLGGGGFMLYCPAKKECDITDYREQAPDAAHSKLYIVDGKPRTDLSQTGALASGVPGVVAGLKTAHEKGGKLPWSKLFIGPIKKAREGILITPYLTRAIEERAEDFNPTAKKAWLGRKSGDIVKQPELAQVLESVRDNGKKGFYEGWVAQKIVQEVRKAGGILTKEDLQNYQVKKRQPLKGKYRGFEIVTMPPPSAGGTLILQMFKYMEYADQEKELDRGFGSVKAVHATAHAMSLAFADRAQWFGDPDFTKIPIGKLLSENYLKERWRESFHSSSANNPGGSGIDPADFPHTTHFSVMDRDGNAVAVTTTINDNFGSAFIPQGTGVFLNDEMDDFTIQPGVANMFGLQGSEANAVQARKRPLSSMSPTMVRDSDGNNRIAVGAAGGPRITTGVFQIILNRLRYGMSLPDAMHAGRIHHQWRPERLRMEKTLFSPDVAEQLTRMGYAVEMARDLAHAHAVERDPVTRQVWGAADPRGEGDSVPQ